MGHDTSRNCKTPEIRPAVGQDEVAAAVAVRIAVFVEEQGGPAEDEPDEWDAVATHFVVVTAARVVGTARLCVIAPEVGKIGRVALLPPYRGLGWGRRLVERVIEDARELDLTEVVLHSQAYAMGFYAGLGFTPDGPEFEEAGIPHVRMRLRLRRFSG